MTNLKYYRNLCFVAILTVLSTPIYGQSVKYVIDETVSSYQGTSYQAYHSVTLAPGFSFSPNSTNPSFFVTITSQDQQADDPNLILNNAIRTDIVKVVGITSQTQINASNAQTQISYMDGLGRPIQRITQQGSPLQKDIVQFMVYDQYGHQPKQYLPYASTTTNGSLQTNPAAAQQSFYQTSGQQIATDNAPYAGVVYDNSPLQRVLENGAPGSDWQLGSHTVKSQFRLNTAADNIMIWTATGPSNSYYAETQLSVNDITDENGNHVLSFTNRLGQLVSKKVQAGTTTWLETIYIYDDAGNLLYQVSPEGVKRIYGASPPAFNATFISAWATAYTYDIKGRLVTKQAPGAAAVYMVYDSNNRLVLMQDGRVRGAYATDSWYYTKYDEANRVIMTGLYRYSAPPGATGSTKQQILQNYLDGLTYDNATTFAFEKRQSGTTYGYSNQCFPTNVVDADVLKINYYDDYDFNNTGTPVNQYVNPSQTSFATTAAADNSGLLTGTLSRVISPAGNAGGWIKQALFYDQFGNVIQTQANNLVNQNALDVTSNAVDIYGGHITQTKQVKSLSNTTVINKISYDLMDRLTQVALNVNGAATDQVIGKYEYNEIGQLKDKKLGLVSGSTYLQTVDYRYNIRGWLSSINNSTLTADGGSTNNDTNDLFGMTILYNEADGTGLTNSPKYNGKISEIKWKANDQFSASTNPVRQRAYTYTYDAADRLTNAQYAANSGSAWNVEVNGYNESVGSYDNNGNIQSLTRNIFASGATAFVAMDNLTYNYQNSNSSNQIASVSDASANTLGFNDGASTANEYSYDTNGNLTADANKKEIISYNDINKVSKVAITGGGSIEYTYDASGIRIRKVVYNAAHSPINTYDYLDGFMYSTTGTGSALLTCFNTAEGRALSNTTATVFTYEYFIKDNLGNTRVSFHDNGTGVAAITQENEYYPFGMTMQGIVVRTAQGTTANKQLYNGGSELQDDLGFENSYSTFYREYDPQLGRFNAIDPMVDKYAGWTPYNFAFNDPVGLNDPTGDDIENHYGPPPAEYYGYNDLVSLQAKAYFKALSQYDPRNTSEAETMWLNFLSAPNAFLNPTAQAQIESISAQKQAETQNNAPSHYTFSYLLNETTGGITNFHLEFIDADIGNTKVVTNLDEGPHAQELAKYGYIIQGFSVIVAGGIANKAGAIEYGVITTNKGWTMAYKTVYKSYTIFQGSGSINYFNVSGKNGYHPTFSDWAGPVTETGGNIGFLSGSYGTSTTYTSWSIGAGPGVPNVMGSVNPGFTTLLGSPMYDGPIQKNTGPISNWWINGGYNQ
ncbi:DUF6443 domain-containing protein [Mucilaginibacter sp. OK268]|uniref:DUF6443 domain-containing protein n=1 Tax=Mucilaginibacter sp. OK268 TaxID=1881048 RepID=UPI00159FC87D|nr:DUF6443 domain-containing protein [Mucilaginibacter sp. OK268]